MAMFFSRAAQSPTTTQLAEGYSDSALQSKYDNHKIHQDKHSCAVGRCHHHDCSRPLSQFSGTSLGSKVRLSSFSLLDPIDHTTMLSVHRPSMVAELLSSQTLVEGPIPDTKLGKLKYYYDKYGLRHVSPFIVLFLYSLAGAWLFFLVEHDNEKVLKSKEAIDLNKLRNNTITRIITELSLNRLLTAREQLVVYEKELSKVKLPNSLPWDMWGALFYVGTIFTTIGYGNIVPRTVLGRMLTVVYAIFGIPLVLAILSKFGKFLTKWVSFWWRRYRHHLKAAHKRTKQRLTYSRREKNMENGISLKKAEIIIDKKEEEEKESSTIPIWLALLICVGWICGCAATFLLWEKRWNFFTSLYFFFVSLSTIGLGDVVPDNPHMLILMFWMVIIGLSIVSMLLSVIQIKMEEWLDSLLLEMQREFHRALEEGGPMEMGKAIKKAYEKKGLFTKLIAPKLITAKQAEDIEHKVEEYERAVLEINNKNMQTEFAPQNHGIATQVENNVQSAACDVITIEPFHQETQWSKQFSTPHSVNLLPLRDFNEEDEDQDSTSDATSLPMDTISILGRKASDRRVNFCLNCEPTKEIPLMQAAPPKKNTDCSMQTDIAQFQLDEIALRLATLQSRRVCPALVEKSMETSIAETIDHRGKIMNDELLSEVIDLMSRSIDTDATRTNNFKWLQDGTTSTSDDYVNPLRSMRSMATSPLPMSSQQSAIMDENGIIENILTRKTKMNDQSIQAIIPEKKTDMTNRKTSTMSLQTLIDKVTSPFKFDSDRSISIASEGKGKRKRKEPMTMTTTTNTDEISEYSSAIGGLSQSQQTSLKLPVQSAPQTDHWQQTSVHLTMTSPAESGVNQSQHTSIRDGNCRSQQTSVCGPIPGKEQGLQTVGSSVYDQEQQTSQYSNIITNQAQQTSRLTSPEAADQSQQTSLRMTSPKGSASHQSQQTSLRLTVPSQDGTNQYEQTNAVVDSYCSSCDARQGLSAHDQHTDYASGSSDDGRITYSNRNRAGGKDKLGIKCRARSTSTSGMGNSIFDEDQRQEVIIQTDDSYLKIARRLDEYRSNRTQFLPVCAASPLSAKEVEPFKGDRPCDRRYDPKGLANRKTSMRMRRRLSRTSASQTAPDGLSDGATRSVSVDGGLERSSGLVRKASLPAGIARGKVSDYIQKHEKGIHSPAKDRRKPIQIIRQYSIDSYDKGN